LQTRLLFLHEAWHIRGKAATGLGAGLLLALVLIDAGATGLLALRAALFPLLVARVGTLAGRTLALGAGAALEDR
jgi:hypothetical protein